MHIVDGFDEAMYTLIGAIVGSAAYDAVYGNGKDQESGREFVAAMDTSPLLTMNLANRERMRRSRIDNMGGTNSLKGRMYVKQTVCNVPPGHAHEPLGRGTWDSGVKGVSWCNSKLRWVVNACDKRAYFRGTRAGLQQAIAYRKEQEEAYAQRAA